MKFNNKTLVVFILIVCVLLYAGIIIFPNIFLNIMQENSGKGLQKYSRVTSEVLNIKGMDVITRSDKLYYSPEGAIPTNKVWSSVVFKGNLSGLYTYPFASNTQDGTLNITLPKKIVYPKLVTAQIISEYISVKGKEEVDKVSVESYSDLSVKLNFSNKFGDPIFSATYIQGSPYIYIFPKEDTLNISSAFYKIHKTTEDWVYTYQDKNIGLFSNGSIEQSNNNLSIKFKDIEGGYLTIAALDLNNFDVIKDYASNVIDNVTSSYEILENKINVTYNFNFKKGSNSSSIFGLLPHQYQVNSINPGERLFSFNTLRGDQNFYNIKDFITFAIPRVPLAEAFKFESMSDSDKSYIGSLIERDLKDIVYIRSSTYFGGNDILKLANLLQISNEIGNNDLSTRIKNRLNQEFDDWFNFKSGKSGKYFAFDEAWGGVIGYETSGFGGENYNDHHFQYGYFIHSAAILAKYDPTFVQRYGYFIDNLITDIANTDRNNPNFPYLRYFDQYEGHSWATGFGDFTDGNNQESTSEAVHAWYSVWLWGKITGKKDISLNAEFLYSSEVNSARHYWLNWYNNSAIFPEGYGYNKTSLLWGGKFEYQTFFSVEPQSIEGIQYLPITPGSIYLYNPSVLQRDLEFFKGYLSDVNSHLVDLNYLYYAMLRGFAVLPSKSIEDMKIDPGNSRANMYYWTKFWDSIKSVESITDSGKCVYRITYKNGSQTTL